MTDQAQRREALSHTHSFAVAAPAGSGKTELLTQRVLTLLAKVDKPEEILSITFTRKAAAEMQARILGALKLAQQSMPMEPHKQLTWNLAKAVLEQDKKKDWHLLQHPARLKILTIDGLCHLITQQMPVVAGFGSAAKISEHPQRLYELAVERLLQHLEDDNSTCSEELALLIQHLDNDLNRLQRLLISLLDQRSQWLPYLVSNQDEKTRKYLESTLRDVIEDQLKQCKIQTQSFEAGLLSELADILNYCVHQVLLHSDPDHELCQLKDQLGFPEPTLENATLWQCIAQWLLTSKGEWRGRFTKKEGVPPLTFFKNKEDKQQLSQKKEQLKAITDHLKKHAPQNLQDAWKKILILPHPNYHQRQWDLLDALTQVLPLAVAELSLVFQQFGEVDFTAITHGALQALGDDDAPSELALKLDYQIQHILVDEYQDTSAPQLELLERLTLGWEAQDGRTLFIVGDGMQSCYGFRDANVGIFLAARQQGVGNVKLKPLDLTSNFRSQAGLIDWVNHHFKKAFPPIEDITRGAVPYNPSEAANPALNEPAATFWLCEKDESRTLETHKTVELVKSLRQQYPKERTAILVRTRSHLSQIIPALQQSNLRWQATDIDPLELRPAIVDLMSLLKALLHPADRIAWLSILRAPWCGLTLKDLLAIAGFSAQCTPIWQRLLELTNSLDDRDKSNNNKAQSVSLDSTDLDTREPDTRETAPQQVPPPPDLSQEGLKRVKRLVSVLKPSIEQRGRRPVGHWLKGIWIALGGASYLSENELNDVAVFFRLIEQQKQPGHQFNIPDFESAVSRLYAEPDEKADPNLIIMTIHKSKGLEFENVIIPGLDRGTRSDSDELLLWQQRISLDGKQQLLLSPMTASDQAEKDSIYQYLQAEKKQKTQLESTRLFYVGATRAINRLHFLASAEYDDEKQIWKKPAPNALISPLWEDCVNEGEHLFFKDLPTNPTRKNHLALFNIQRLPSSWKPKALLSGHLLEAYRGKEDIDPLSQLSEETQLDEEALVLLEKNQPSFDIDNKERHIGIVVHKILQYLLSYSNKSLDPHQHWNAFSEQYQPLWIHWLQSSGLNLKQSQQALPLVVHAIKGIIQDPIGKWLLSHEHDESASELPISWVRHRKTQHFIVDRTFVDQGIRWIIDYKVTQPKSQQSLENFIEENIQQYRSQLDNYRRYFLQLENRTIKTALYFPLLPKLVEVSF